MLVYLLINTKNLKKYVGKTTIPFKKRLRHHKSSGNRLDKIKTVLAADINKYGWDSFEAYILQECKDREELYHAEYDWISKLDTVRNGYNTYGDRTREIAKEELSPNKPQKKRGTREWTKKQRKFMSKLRKGKPLTPEHKERIARASVLRNAKRYREEKRDTPPAAILTWTSVREIRKLWNEGVYLTSDLATKFGVTKATICRIVYNHTWKEDAN